MCRAAEWNDKINFQEKRVALGWYWFKEIFFRQVKDPELLQKLSPTSDFGCKRILVSNDRYSTLQQPNVTLVTNRIRQMKPHSLLLMIRHRSRP
ncbi:unnamed protein product [Rotaria sordida]|nr:unnamed protein product [Rotaria sordida]